MKNRTMKIVMLCVLVTVCCSEMLTAAQRTADPRFVEVGAGGIALLDSKTGGAFVSASGEGTTADDGMLHHVYQNKANTEILDLISQPGDVVNAFATIRVMRRDMFPFGAISVSLQTFVSSKGIRIGAESRGIIKILGKPASMKNLGSSKVAYSYSCDDPKLCPVLAKYNRSTYVATLLFVADHLVDYSFGFEYE